MASVLAYKISQFMIFFNFAMVFVNLYVSPLIFPDQAVGLSTSGDQFGTPKIVILNVDIMDFFYEPDSSGILSMILAGSTLALFAFSLLVPTIPIVGTLFWFGSMILTQFYFATYPLNTLPDVILWSFRFCIFLAFFYGFSQFAARSSFQGS